MSCGQVSLRYRSQNEQFEGFQTRITWKRLPSASRIAAGLIVNALTVVHNQIVR